MFFSAVLLALKGPCWASQVVCRSKRSHHVRWTFSSFSIILPWFVVWFWIFFFLSVFQLQYFFLSCVCSASSLWGLLLYDTRICSSLSGSWSVSRAWRPYRMRVEAAESERHCENRGECVCMKASEEDWWKLTNIKNPREKEGVCSKNKKTGEALSL